MRAFFFGGEGDREGHICWNGLLFVGAKSRTTQFHPFNTLIWRHWRYIFCGWISIPPYQSRRPINIRQVEQNHFVTVGLQRRHDDDALFFEGQLQDVCLFKVLSQSTKHGTGSHAQAGCGGVMPDKLGWQVRLVAEARHRPGTAVFDQHHLARGTSLSHRNLCASFPTTTAAPGEREVHEIVTVQEVRGHLSQGHASSSPPRFGRKRCCVCQDMHDTQDGVVASTCRGLTLRQR